MSEKNAIAGLEAFHLKKQRRVTYLALEELDFSWSEAETREMKRLWNDGTPLEDIAEHFGREADECFILLFDLARKGKIKYRTNSIHGNL
jgi:hypothetical protein